MYVYVLLLLIFDIKISGWIKVIKLIEMNVEIF